MQAGFSGDLGAAVRTSREVHASGGTPGAADKRSRHFAAEREHPPIAIVTKVRVAIAFGGRHPRQRPRNARGIAGKRGRVTDVRAHSTAIEA